MLQLNDISVRFGTKPVLEGCSLRLEQGRRVALMGPSGCGKTTLGRVALLLQIPSSGTVTNRFTRTAAVFQEPRLLPWATAAENVNLVLTDRAESLPEARAWLERLELGEAAGLYPGALSGGMQQRLSLARALAARPELLVLDEPFKAMDEALKERVMRVTAQSLGTAALLLITHSEQEAAALGCERVEVRTCADRGTPFLAGDRPFPPGTVWNLALD